MKQFKKLLSVLLAIILVLSSVSVLASATEWRDSAIAGQYNSIDVPTLTTEQYASAALDEVDRMLAEEKLVLTEEDIFVGTLDLSSVNTTLDSVNTILNGSLWSNYKGLLGELSKLSIGALTARRGADTDTAVLNSLLQFLADNASLLSGFVKTTDPAGYLGGIVGQFVDVSEFEVPKLLKGLLYELVYPDSEAPDVVTQSVDTMAQDIIDALFITGFDGEEPLLPAAAGYTNISSGSMLQFLDNALKLAYNEYVVPRANEVWMGDLNELIAETEEIEKYKSYFNLKEDGTCNFEFQTFDFDPNKLVLEQLNDMLGSIINLALADDIGFEWESGDNSMIVTNIINIGKEVLTATGDELFASYVEIKSAEELETMSEQETVAYVVRTILNSSIDGVWIPNTADSIVKVGSYLVKDLMATELPERDYSNETAYPVDDINTVYTILTDFGIKALNENPGLNLQYGIGLDGLATAAANWAIGKYGGLLSGVQLDTSKTGWQNLDTLLFKIVNRNWFDSTLFPGGEVTAEKLIKDVLIGNIVNLDLENVVALLTNKSSSSDFVSKTPKQFIIDLVVRVLNIVFPGFLNPNMTSLEEIITAQNLGNSVEAILNDLNDYRATLVPCVLPIVTDVLDLTCPQEFKKPTFDIEKLYYISTGSANITFDITNPSYGVNTGYTDPVTGQFHQDSRFGIQLVSITAEGTISGTNPPQKVTFQTVMPSDTLVDGGQTVSAGIKGAFTGSVDTVVTISYNLIKEDGQPLTSAPLEARIYTCISKQDTDETTEWKSTTGNYRANGGIKNIYTTSIKGLASGEFKFKNMTAAEATAVSYATNLTAAASMTSVGGVIQNPNSATALAGGQITYAPLVWDGDAFNAAAGIAEGDDSETKAAKVEAYEATVFGTNGFKKFNQTIGVKMNNTAVSTVVTINLYKDYGLTSLFNNEVKAQRQRSDYDSAAFDTYLAAMAQAASLINGKKNANSFSLTTANGMANKYEPYAATLTSAVEGLEATAQGGVEALRARLTEIDPSNKDKDFMTDGDYSFFGAANYLTYTWSNFRDAQEDADDFASKYELGGKYGPDSETPEKPEALDVAMKTWELNNYYARLRPINPSKVNLSRAVSEANAKNYDGTLYSEESFARYEAAIAFASSVNAQANAEQKKINMAYVELIEAQKRLLAADGGEEELIIDAATENPYNPDYAPVIFENCDGEMLLYGVAPEDEIDDISLYFTAVEGDLADVEFDYSKIATGATVTLYNANTGDEIATYIMVMKGDVDGNGAIRAADASTISRFCVGLAEFSESAESAKDYAADVDCNGAVRAADASAVSRFCVGLADLDFASHKF